MSLQSRLTTKCPHLEYMISILTNTLCPGLDNCICTNCLMMIPPTSQVQCSLDESLKLKCILINLSWILRATFTLSCLVYWWKRKMFPLRPPLQWGGRTSPIPLRITIESGKSNKLTACEIYFCILGHIHCPDSIWQCLYTSVLGKAIWTSTTLTTYNQDNIPGIPN